MNRISANELALPEAGSQTARFGLVGILAGIFFPVIASIIKISELQLPLTPAAFFHVQQVEQVLWITDTAPLFLGLVAAIAGWRQDVVDQANQDLRTRSAELDSIRARLEEGIAERTSELDKRNHQLRDVVGFATQLSDVQDLAALRELAVSIIAERFGYQDVNLFELDDALHSAVLRASASPTGKRLVAEGFRVATGDQNVVGRVARRGKYLLSPARTERHDQSATPSVTRPFASRITLPLTVRGRVIGVLDAHPGESQAAAESDAEIMQLIADQLAASIDNARLVAESHAMIAQLESMAAHSTQSSWQKYQRINQLAYQYTPAGVRAFIPDPKSDDPEGHKIMLMLRGQVIGAIQLKKKPGMSWTQPDYDLMERVAGQVSLALENARLLEETRQRATQEETIGEISARFSRSLDVDGLLQSAVREFAALPDVAEAAVLLTPAGKIGQKDDRVDGA